MLVTLRAAADVPSLRSIALFGAVRAAIASVASNRFRVLHFSVQQDHVQAIVEADGHAELTCGIRSLTIRLALAIKRVARIGKVWGDRYHARALTTPREVRHAIAYVLLNFRTHLRAPPGVDPRSSSPWFDGWARPPAPPRHPRPTAAPRTWLASAGWRPHGSIHFDEGPNPSRKFAR